MLLRCQLVVNNNPGCFDKITCWTIYITFIDPRSSRLTCQHSLIVLRNNLGIPLALQVHVASLSQSSHPSPASKLGQLWQVIKPTTSPQGWGTQWIGNEASHLQVTVSIPAKVRSDRLLLSISAYVCVCVGGGCLK